MYYKLAPLILTPGKKASTTSDIYIAQPDAIKESLAGKLFILVEIEGKNQDNLKIINFLIDNINYNYYQNEKILLREKISTLKVEHIFESALAKTNKNFNDFLENEKIKIDINDINIITGIIYEDSIHFVNNGDNKAFLVYRHKIEGKKNGKKKEDDKIEYKISDIIEQAGSNKNKLEEKLFTNVISGKIPKKGHFIITNETLPEYISTKQLTKIVTSLPPASAVEQMKNILTEINSYVSFLGIVIKSTTTEPEEKKQEDITNLNTKESISTLNRTEENTENLLSPSGVVNPKQWVKVPNFIEEKINKKNNNKKFTKPFVIKDKIFGKRKSTFSFIKKTFANIKNTFIYFISALIKTFKNRSSEKKAETSQDIKSKLINLFKFKGLNNTKNKILLTLSLIFIVLFFINITVIKIKKEKQAQIAEYKNLITEIEKKQNQAEAFLLYNNEESAKAIFPEIKELLANFPQETEEQITQYQELKDKYDLQNEKVRNVIRLEDLTEVANLKNVNENANPQNIILSLKNNKIYAADNNEKSIYISDLDNNNITTATDLDSSINKFISPSLTSGNDIYYLTNNNVIELNKNNSLNKLSIDTTNISEISKSDVYNDRLYVLNQDKNQIYKFSRSGDDFGSGQVWLNRESNFTNAVDISIDGHIYILKNNGEILKFLKGNPVELSMEKVDPEINNATRLHVSSELKFIYVLDPENNRLVIFDKTGSFLNQYTSSQFNELKDFSIDEENGFIYFLNDSSILKAQASHL
jgi:hypothetical protein